MSGQPSSQEEHLAADRLAPGDSFLYDGLVARYSRDLVALIEPGGGIIYASPSFQSSLGYEPTHLAGQQFFKLLHPADLASLLEQWPSLDTAGTLCATCRALHADGGWRWLSLTLSAQEGSAARVVCVAQDISDRRQTELQLARLLRHNELVLNSITEGMFGADVNGNITFMNTAAARLLGWEPVELIGRSAHAALCHTRPDGTPFAEHESPLLSTARDGQTHRVTDGVFWRKDGAPLPVDYVCSPIIQSQTITGIVVVFQDITERRELQAQFLQAQKMETMGRLVGSVAHDFNNLLTSIIGYASLARMTAAPDDALAESLSEIEKGGYRAAALTRQLLAFARKQAVELRPMLLNDLLVDLEKLLRRLLGPEITLEFSPDAGLAPTLGDSGQLSQVVMNLVVNARDAMPHGGRLSLQTRAVTFGDADHHRPPHLPPGPYAALVVADTGCGMPPEVVERIFEPFFTTKEVGAGTGLGLATCYGVVQQHRGAITVSSDPGRGTTFHVYLPALAGEATGEAAAPLDEPAYLQGAGETILVAEDDDTVRQLVGTILRDAGYTVIEAASGEQALAYAQPGRPAVDLLVADIVMPRLRGTALARQFTAIRNATRVLFVSGQIDDEIIQHGQLLPGLQFLAKPFSSQELLRKVRQVLDA